MDARWSFLEQRGRVSSGVSPLVGTPRWPSARDPLAPCRSTPLRGAAPQSTHASTASLRMAPGSRRGRPRLRKAVASVGSPDPTAATDRRSGVDAKALGSRRWRSSPNSMQRPRSPGERARRRSGRLRLDERRPCGVRPTAGVRESVLQVQVERGLERLGHPPDVLREGLVRRTTPQVGLDFVVHGQSLAVLREFLKSDGAEMPLRHSTPGSSGTSCSEAPSRRHEAFDTSEFGRSPRRPSIGSGSPSPGRQRGRSG